MEKIEITDDYVSFEVAKLLKDKGFNEDCYTYFISDDEIAAIPIKRDFNNHGIYLSAPTHQMAMKWLREKYNIYISIHPDFPSDKDYKMCWCCTVNILHEDCIGTNWYQCYIETYEEATEIALKYALENLIDSAIYLPKLSGHIDNDSVEYIRKDDFIEKTINFLNYKLDDIVATRVPGTIIPYHVAKSELINDLKNFMEG